jgi:type VI secretion system protein ImpF
VRDDQVPLTLSVLDRLLDSAENAGAPAGQRPRAHTVNDLKAAIRRDVEDLLNTYRRAQGVPPDLKALEDSVFTYGVPDMLAENLATVARRRQVVADLEAAIRRWEPRLSHLEVTMLDNADAADRSLRFRISAEIDLDPAAEPVIFDSVVDPASNTVLVTSRSRG